MKKPGQTCFKSLVSSIRTSTGGGWKLTLEVPDSEVESIRDLMVFKDMLVETAIVLLPQ